MIKLKPYSAFREITFSADGFLLKGTLHLPKVNHPPVVIGSHGLLSTSKSPKQLELSRQCNANNIAYFRFDHRGCGESEGKFQDVTSLNARKNDLLSAIKTIKLNPKTGSQIGVFGSSLGGAAGLAAASIADVKALVVFAAPLRIDKTIDFDGFPKESAYAVNGKVDLQFDISNDLTGISNILIFHGDADSVVPFSNALEIYDKVCEPKKLIRQKNGDHMMSHIAHQKIFIKKTVKWFKTAFKRSSI